MVVEGVAAWVIRTEQRGREGKADPNEVPFGLEAAASLRRFLDLIQGRAESLNPLGELHLGIDERSKRFSELITKSLLDRCGDPHEVVCAETAAAQVHEGVR